MSFAERLWDDTPFGKPGAPMPSPRLASSLLEELGLLDADHADQVVGVREWLTKNTATPSLLATLRMDGLAEAVPAEVRTA